jgi:hypothetical protein
MLPEFTKTFYPQKTVFEFCTYFSVPTFHIQKTKNADHEQRPAVKTTTHECWTQCKLKDNLTRTNPKSDRHSEDTTMTNGHEARM